MRRLRHAARSCNTSRLDGAEAKCAIVINRHAAETGEITRQRLVLRVIRVRVSSVLVRLPDFQNCVINRLTIAIQYAPPNYGFFVRRRGWRDIVDVEWFESDAEVGADGLRGGGGQVHVICPAVSRCARAIRCRSDNPEPAPAPWCPCRNRLPAGNALSRWQCC